MGKIKYLTLYIHIVLNNKKGIVSLVHVTVDIMIVFVREKIILFRFGRMAKRERTWNTKRDEQKTSRLSYNHILWPEGLTGFIFKQLYTPR